jgi:hypothetical protein
MVSNTLSNHINILTLIYQHVKLSSTSTCIWWNLIRTITKKKKSLHTWATKIKVRTLKIKKILNTKYIIFSCYCGKLFVYGWLLEAIRSILLQGFKKALEHGLEPRMIPGNKMRKKCHSLSAEKRKQIHVEYFYHSWAAVHGNFKATRKLNHQQTIKSSRVVLIRENTLSKYWQTSPCGLRRIIA